METTKTSRRGFLMKTLLGVVTLLGAPALFSACGSSSSSGGSTTTPTTGGNCSANGTPLETTGETEGHTHTFQLTAAQLASATTSSTFQVSNVGHTHNVQFTSAQLQSLQANQGVSLTTAGATTDGHTHSLTVNCA